MVEQTETLDILFYLCSILNRQTQNLITNNNKQTRFDDTSLQVLLSKTKSNIFIVYEIFKTSTLWITHMKSNPQYGNGFITSVQTRTTYISFQIDLHSFSTIITYKTWELENKMIPNKLF